ncbi:hypothetical protein CAEBREN_03094 [Caenorhabditis brenneri]|uniref:Uncharacterized protein n=1 Tax=Caenorhabditis brenneri TaxID=135651 RepID=G0M916_CAEBE|nr:hypothetical protein CAEBREN_03094 [Caenorhabditis brenneri]
MQFLLALFFILGAAEACAPGTGTLGTKANYVFKMNPPVMYTYHENITPPQVDKNFAYYKCKSDVQSSINQVLQANSIPLNDINPPTVTFEPPHLQIGSACNETFVNRGIVEGSAVWYTCEEKTVGDAKEYDLTNFNVTLTVQITAISAIYQSQWESLASQVEDKLRALRGAEFAGETVVTVSN